MIIAWTIFIILALVSLMGLLGLIISFFVDTPKEQARFFWFTAILVILTSLPAQYIFGG